MDKQTPSWLQSYQQPFVKKQNVQCASRHIHQQNMPAAGFVFVRLNASTKLEVLLDLRSKTVADGDTWAFIGGYANDINEDDLAVAYREALEEYGITRDEISLLGLSYKRDHGGIKYLTYTYIFAEYSPADGQAPAPLSHESVRSEWFNLEEGGPTNLNKYIKEDRNMIDHVLKEMVWPMLAEARGLDCANVSPQTPQHDSSAQNQASSPKKPEAPAAKPKTPTSNTSRPVTPRPTVQGNTVARPSTAAQEKAPLSKKEGWARHREVTGGNKIQQGEILKSNRQPGKTEEEKGKSMAAAKPNGGGSPSSFVSSWFNFFKSKEEEPATKDSPTPPPPATNKRQAEDQGKQPAKRTKTEVAEVKAPAAKKPAAPVPESQSASGATPTTPTPKPRKAVPRPRQIPGAATPGTTPSTVPSSSSSSSPPAPAQAGGRRPIVNPFSPLHHPRVLNKSMGGKKMTNPFPDL